MCQNVLFQCNVVFHLLVIIVKGLREMKTFHTWIFLCPAFCWLLKIDSREYKIIDIAQDYYQCHVTGQWIKTIELLKWRFLGKKFITYIVCDFCCWETPKVFPPSVVISSPTPFTWNPRYSPCRELILGWDCKIQAWKGWELSHISWSWKGIIMWAHHNRVQVLST